MAATVASAQVPHHRLRRRLTRTGPPARRGLAQIRRRRSRPKPAGAVGLGPCWHSVPQPVEASRGRPGPAVAWSGPSGLAGPDYCCRPGDSSFRCRVPTPAAHTGGAIRFSVFESPRPSHSGCFPVPPLSEYLLSIRVFLSEYTHLSPSV